MNSARRCTKSLRARAPARSAGFTLIEVLIAIVVVGILTAIALPQYTTFVQRSRIVDATSTMNDIRTRQEQFFQDRLRYDDGAGACGTLMPVPPPSPNFTFACLPVGGAPAPAYRVVATGVGPMLNFDYDITVDPRPAGVGVLRTTLSVPAKWMPIPVPNNCWQVRTGGYCS